MLMDRRKPVVFSLYICCSANDHYVHLVGSALLAQRPHRARTGRNVAYGVSGLAWQSPAHDRFQVRRPGLENMAEFCAENDQTQSS